MFPELNQCVPRTKPVCSLTYSPLCGVATWCHGQQPSQHTQYDLQGCILHLVSDFFPCLKFDIDFCPLFFFKLFLFSHVLPDFLFFLIFTFSPPHSASLPLFSVFSSSSLYFPLISPFFNSNLLKFPLFLYFLFLSFSFFHFFSRLFTFFPYLNPFFLLYPFITSSYLYILFLVPQNFPYPIFLPFFTTSSLFQNSEKILMHNTFKTPGTQACRTGYKSRWTHPTYRTEDNQ